MPDVIIGNPGALVAPVDELRAQLDRLTAVAPGAPDAGRLNGSKMILFKNDVHPTKDSVLGDFTPATFPGYATSAAIVWGAAFEAEDGSAQIVGPTVQFLSDDLPDPVETVYGYCVVNGDADELIFAERFAAPIQVDHEGQPINVVPVYALPRP